MHTHIRARTHTHTHTHTHTPLADTYSNCLYIFVARYVVSFHVLLMHFHTYGCRPADMSTYMRTCTTHLQSENMYLSTEWEGKMLSWHFPWYWHWCLTHCGSSLSTHAKIATARDWSHQRISDTSVRDALPPSLDKLCVMVKCGHGKSTIPSFLV
jgi:hypothetical protein